MQAPITCYCDYCLEGFCKTSQLCYTEWKFVPENDELVAAAGMVWNSNAPQLNPSVPYTIPDQTPVHKPPFTASSLPKQSAPPTMESLSSSMPTNTINYSTITALNNTANSNASQLLLAQNPIKNLTSSYATVNLSNLNIPHHKLIESFNCFDTDNVLFIDFVCNENPTNTSYVMRRCCRQDNCNSPENMLTYQQEVFGRFLKFSQALPDNSIYAQFSSLNILMQTLIIISTVAFIVLMVVSIKRTTEIFQLNRRRRRHSDLSPRRPSLNDSTVSDYGATATDGTQFKRILNRFLSNVGQRRSRIRSSGPTMPSGPVTSESVANQSRLGEPSDLRTDLIARTNLEIRLEPTDSITVCGQVVGFDNDDVTTREPRSRAQIKKKLSSSTAGAHHQQSSVLVSDDAQEGAFLTSGIGLKANRTSSGSGFGQPYLVPRSVSHDVELCEVVGRGFFGVVWRAEYKGAPVAVKVFSPVAEASWERESEIYQTSLLRHKNILGFIASDKRFDALSAGYWLVTDYYPMGSLYDFLKGNTMSMMDAFRMAYSIANGLSHLHTEITGTQGKPAIAHRDIKSKNILVKNDGTCCLGDLGMAVRFSTKTGCVDVPANVRVGTRRYLAPEVLDQKLDLKNFEAVKATDMYAFGLVLWEIIRRACLMHPSGGNLLDIGVPYSYDVPVATPSHISGPATVRAKLNEGGSVAAPEPDINPQPGTSRMEYGQILSDKVLETFSPSQAGKDSTNVKQVAANIPTRFLSEQQLAQTPQMPLVQAQSREVMDLVRGGELAYMCEPYEAPYQNYVSLDPSTAEMHEIVCVRRIRPEMSIRWTKFFSMRDYIAIMTECWYERPQARLSSLRARKSMGDLAKKHFNLNMDFD